MSKKLYIQYAEWIDHSVYEGLSQEEREKLEEEHKREYGLNHVLRADAPESAVEAWKRQGQRAREGEDIIRQFLKQLE